MAPATSANNYIVLVASDSADPSKEVILEYIKNAFIETIPALPDATPAQPIYYAITMNMNALSAAPQEQFKYAVEADQLAGFATLIALFPSATPVDIDA